MHVDKRDLNKHKNDVFRLFAIMDPQAKIPVSESVAKDLQDFIALMEKETIDLRAIGIQDITVSEILQSLLSMFLLD